MITCFYFAEWLGLFDFDLCNGHLILTCAMVRPILDFDLPNGYLILPSQRFPDFVLPNGYLILTCAGGGWGGGISEEVFGCWRVTMKKYSVATGGLAYIV